MFYPKYTITNSSLRNIGLIDAAREVILSAHLIPAWSSKLQRQSLESVILSSTHLEGNKLYDEDIANLLDGRDVSGNNLDIVEVRNFIEALRYIERVRAGGSFILGLDQIIEVH